MNIGSRGIPGVTVDKSEANRLTATILEGTDRVTIRIDDEYLVFLTSAAFSTGSTEGSRFPLVENTPDYIKAIESFRGGGLESFVLNKQSGLAIWTKLQPSLMLASPGVPDSQTIYLTCG